MVNDPWKEAQMYCDELNAVNQYALGLYTALAKAKKILSRYPEHLDFVEYANVILESKKDWGPVSYNETI